MGEVRIPSDSFSPCLDYLRTNRRSEVRIAKEGNKVSYGTKAYTTFYHSEVFIILKAVQGLMFTAAEDICLIEQSETIISGQFWLKTVKTSLRGKLETENLIWK